MSSKKHEAAELPAAVVDPKHSTPDTRTENEVQGGFETAGKPVAKDSRPPTQVPAEGDGQHSDSSQGASNVPAGASAPGPKGESGDGTGGGNAGGDVPLEVADPPEPGGPPAPQAQKPLKLKD